MTGGRVVTFTAAPEPCGGGHIILPCAPRASGLEEIARYGDRASKNVRRFVGAHFAFVSLFILAWFVFCI